MERKVDENMREMLRMVCFSQIAELVDTFCEHWTVCCVLMEEARSVAWARSYCHLTARQSGWATRN